MTTDVSPAPAPDSKPADAAPAPVVDAKPADATPAPAVDVKPADAKPADAKPADATPADVKPADAKPADAAPVVPEKYEAFKPPEGDTIDPAVEKTFAEVAKELKLPQADAQKVIDKIAPVLKARADAQFTELKSNMLAASQADKEIGGEKFAENVAVAKLARDAFFTPAFNKFLDDTGLGNHPEMIRGLYKAGLTVKPDGFVHGGKDGNTTGDVRSFYPNSKMNA